MEEGYNIVTGVGIFVSTLFRGIYEHVRAEMPYPLISPLLYLMSDYTYMHCPQN